MIREPSPLLRTTQYTTVSPTRTRRPGLRRQETQGGGTGGHLVDTLRMVCAHLYGWECSLIKFRDLASTMYDVCVCVCLRVRMCLSLLLHYTTHFFDLSLASTEPNIVSQSRGGRFCSRASQGPPPLDAHQRGSRDREGRVP